MSGRKPASVADQSPNFALKNLRLAILLFVAVLLATVFLLTGLWIDRSTQNLDFSLVSYATCPLSIGAALAGFFIGQSASRWIRISLTACFAVAALAAFIAFIALSNRFVCNVPTAHPSRFLISDKFRNDPDHKIDPSQSAPDLLLNWNLDPAEIYDADSLALIQTSLQAAWIVTILGFMATLGIGIASIGRSDPIPPPVVPFHPTVHSTWRTPTAALGGALAASLLIIGGFAVWKSIADAHSPSLLKEHSLTNAQSIEQPALAARSAENKSSPIPSSRGVELDQLGRQFDGGHKWAIVIGVNDYLDPTFKKLRYCVSDAKLMASELIDHCGYDSDHVLLMTDDQPQPHLLPLLANFEVQIRGWLSKCEPGDTVLVFFAGHGILDARGNGYLVPLDCRKGNAALTAWPTDELRKLLHACAATQKILILDCCHAGGSERGDAEPTGPSSQELGQSFARAEGLITLASCKKNETSEEWERVRHGLFTYYLAQGLAGAADFDHNGIVDSDEIYRYTMDHVPLTAQRELNAPPQTPVRLIADDVTGVFALAKISTASNAPNEKLP